MGWKSFIVMATRPEWRSDGVCFDCDEFSPRHAFRLAIWEGDAKVTTTQLCGRCFQERGWNAHYYKTHPETEALF